MPGPSTGNPAGLEWVENPEVQLPEIRFVSRGDDQLVNACNRGNHKFLRFVASLPLSRLCLLAAKSTR